MSIEQFFDLERWPINRLETAVIQILRTALLHPDDTQARQDIEDVCSALEQRAYIQFKDASDRWTSPLYLMSPPDVVKHGLAEIQEGLMRRLVLAQYARYIYEEVG
jgi:hypothetical protein